MALISFWVDVLARHARVSCICFIGVETSKEMCLKLTASIISNRSKIPVQIPLLGSKPCAMMVSRTLEAKYLQNSRWSQWLAADLFSHLALASKSCWFEKILVNVSPRNLLCTAEVFPSCALVLLAQVSVRRLDCASSWWWYAREVTVLQKSSSVLCCFLNT